MPTTASISPDLPRITGAEKNRFANYTMRLNRHSCLASSAMLAMLVTKVFASLKSLKPPIHPDTDTEDFSMSEWEQSSLPVASASSCESFIDVHADRKPIFSSAKKISGRNAGVFRSDAFGNVIMSVYWARNLSPISFRGLVTLDPDTLDAKGLPEAVQSEYMGKSAANSFTNAIKLPADNANGATIEQFHTLLDLIEIAIIGYPESESCKVKCWTPSEIHRRLLQRKDDAIKWVKTIHREAGKYGKTGYNTIFWPQGIGLVDFNNVDAQQMKHYETNPQKYFINNNFNIPECSNLSLVPDPQIAAAYPKFNFRQVTFEAEATEAYGSTHQIPKYTKPLLKKPSIVPEASKPPPLLSDEDFPALGQSVNAAAAPGRSLPQKFKKFKKTNGK